MRSGLSWFQQPVARTHACLALLLVACLSSPGAAAETRLLMRADCNGSVITAKEGFLAGYEDFVQLSSVHHDLEAPAALDLTRQEPIRLTSFRIAKVFTGSSVLLTQTMAQGKGCHEIRIDHLVPDSGSGQLVLRWQLILENAYVVARKEWSSETTAPTQDSFSFVPESVQWSFFRQDGSPGPVFKWNFVTSSS